MRIVLFTPVSSQSAIAGASAQLVEALNRRDCQLSIVRTESEEFLNDLPRAFGGEIVPWTDERAVLELAARADANVFQVGDHYGFHAGALRWLDDLPGVVCLHDFFLGNLFLGWQHGKGTHGHRIVERLYGVAASDAFIRAAGVDQETFVAEAADRAPMTEWVASMATAVLTHSHWGMNRVRAACPGPSVVAPLLSIRAVPPSVDRRRRSSDQPLRLVTIGNANANKRIDRVIEAIGRNADLRALVEYRHLGAATTEMKASLLGIAHRMGVDFAMLGQVSEDELAAALERADGAACLRFPSLEASSASLRDAMLWGLPTIVTNMGSSADVPDDLTLKVDPEREVEQIAAALRTMVAEPGRVRALGERAREWAIAIGDPDTYAAALVHLVERSLQGAPAQIALRRAVKVLAQWQASTDVYDEEYFWGPLRIFGEAWPEGSGQADGGRDA